MVFYGLIGTEMHEVEIDGKSIIGARGGIPIIGEIPTEILIPESKESPYHILDMSWTALLMLRWYDELEKMPVFWLMQKIMRWLYLEYSMKMVFPGWLDLKTMQPMNHLNASPETSLSVTFT